jgi:putative NADH-flavin reductase
MRITVFGASGRTGRLVVHHALRAGHEVIAAVRNPSRVPISHPRLRVVRTDLSEPGQVETAVEAADAVISALGATSRNDTSAVCSVGTASIVKAMQTTGAARLLVISAAPLADVDDNDGLLYRAALRPLLRAVLKRVYADMVLMEREVRDSGLAWTIVRPPGLTDKPASGHYRTAVDHNLRRGYTISRDDLAAELLALAGDESAVRHVISIAN